MFKKCTYFFIPFLLYSSTYGMDDLQKDFFNLNHDELSYPAQSIFGALLYVLTVNSSKEEAEKEFTTIIRKINQSPIYVKRSLLSTYKVISEYKKDIEPYITLPILFNSEILQGAFNAIKNNSQKDQEEALYTALLQSKVVQNETLKPALHDEDNTKKDLSDKEDDNAKYDKTNTDKKLKIPGNKNKKEDAKKPTISQGFPFSKVIVVTGILSVIALLYHKHSKAQEHNAQVA